MKNLRPVFSGDDFENIGRLWARNPLFRPWATLLTLYFNKERYFKWARQNLQKAGNLHFSCIDFNLETLISDGFKVTLTLKDGYEFCQEYFLIVKGAMELLPRFRGYSTVDVTMTWIKRGAVYENIFYRKTITDYQFLKKISRMFNAWATFRELNDAHEALLARYQELEKARVIEKQQTLQIQTAYEICQVIRQGLNLYFTLDANVRALVEIAGFAAAEIDISTDTEGNPVNKTIFQGTIPSNIAPIVESLKIGINEIGPLKAWPSSIQINAEMNELLNRAMPTINMAIHDALVYNTLLDYQNNLERKVKERTSELMKARNKLTQTVRLLKKAQNSRDRFFANISHEFRTPLTLILGPVNAMLAQTRNMKKRQELSLIQQNARRLNWMINQLLDLSRLEAGRMTLQAKPENMVALLNRIVESFVSYAQSKMIGLKFYSKQDFVDVYVDQDKIESIFYNLLSNAIKFTPAGGNIEIRVDLQQSAEPVVREKKTGSSLRADTVASHFLVDGDTTHIDSTIIDGSRPVITGPSGTGRTTIACPWQPDSISAGWRRGIL